MTHFLRTECPISAEYANARYQHCKLVKKKASQLKIDLIFLPPYSPNLNLIERYWNYMKKKCLNSVYNENFSFFKNAIIKCLRMTNIGKEIREELSGLMALNFQIFKKSQLQAA